MVEAEDRIWPRETTWVVTPIVNRDLCVLPVLWHKMNSSGRGPAYSVRWWGNKGCSFNGSNSKDCYLSCQRLKESWLVWEHLQRWKKLVTYPPESENIVHPSRLCTKHFCSCRLTVAPSGVVSAYSLCVCVHACVRACVRACMRACVRVCVWVLWA